MADHEHGKWRRSETISIATLITLASWIWYASSKIVVWDDAAATVRQMKPMVDDHSTQLAVIASNLADIKEDLRYLRRHAK